MLQIFEYELPFRSAFRTGSSIHKSRTGIILRFTKGDMDFVSEASPLPGFSKESVEGLKQSLLKHQKKIESFLTGDFTFNDVRQLSEDKDLRGASLQFGLSFLALSVLAERKGKTIFDLFKSIPAELLGVNDVIGHAPAPEMEKRIEESIQKGFRVIKIKSPHPIDELADVLSGFQEKYYGIQFRLDANQSWPTSSIQKNCELLRNINIQYIEEPGQIKDLSDIKEVQDLSGIPIALDESLLTAAPLRTILREYPDIYLIIKPMLLGNILQIYETISKYRSCFKRIVCTTALESAIGRSMVATTASLAGDKNIPHGLNTGHLFASDLLPDTKIENGLLETLQQKPAFKSFQNIEMSYLKQLE